MKTVQTNNQTKTTTTFTIAELDKAGVKHSAWYDDNGFLNIDYIEGRKELDFEKYVRRSVIDSDYKLVIKENLLVREKGNPVLIYIFLDDFHEGNLVREIQKIKFNYMNRAVGLISYSRTFGYMPRVTMKRDFCTSSNLVHENPTAHQMACELGKHITQYYKQYCPDMFEFHSEKAEKINDDWKITGTPFSSGIINKNNALKYHFDAGNIRGVYSNMICLKKECEGGFLSLPEFDIALEVANRTVVFFNGQEILHGVSQFKLNSLDGYRFTIVYYTLHQMWKCAPIDEEVARIRNTRRKREEKRLRMMRGEEVDPNLVKEIEEDLDDTVITKKYQPYGHNKILDKKGITLKKKGKLRKPRTNEELAYEVPK